MAACRTRATAHGLLPVGGPLFRPAVLILVASAGAACELPPEPEASGLMAPAADAGAGAEADQATLDLDRVGQQTQLGLAVLHARGAARLLSKSCSVRGPSEPVSHGQRLVLAIEVRNPFPEAVELLRPDDGFGLEFRFQVERSFPGGGHERTSQIRVVRLDERIALGPGESFRRDFDFELDPGDPVSALWQVELGLQMRIAGLQVGDRSLPLAEFELRPARLLALPEGWQDLAQDPLAKMVQAAALDSPLADRHLLVCAALLPPTQVDAAVQALAEALPASPSPERAVTIAVALEHLTGLGLGATPQRWIEWWASRQNERP